MYRSRAVIQCHDRAERDCSLRLWPSELSDRSSSLASAACGSYSSSSLSFAGSASDPSVPSRSTSEALLPYRLAANALRRSTRSSGGDVGSRAAGGAAGGSDDGSA